MTVELNDDVELVNEIKRQLQENGGYCPCKVQRNNDTKCMCKEFRDQIKRQEKGECHCGLYKYA